jgi:hypothetical protein
MSRADGTTRESHDVPAGRHGSRVDGRALRALWHAALPLLILGIIAVVDFPICPTRLGFGVPCPGCGLTRATVAMMHLDLVGVLRFHPLAPIITPLVVWGFGKPVLLQLGWLKPEQLKKLPRVPQAFWVILAIAMIVLWVGRLAGYFGGHPDPLDLTQGLFFRGGKALFTLLG